MKKLFAKFLLILLATSMLLPSFTVFSSEEQGSTENESHGGVTWEDVLAGIATPYDYFGELDPATVPDAVGMETALSRVHIERLYEEETGLNDAVFLNPDGSKTLYMFDYPIKYIDEDGKVRDITLEIADSDLESAAFESAGGDAVTTFSARASDGINLEGNGTSITMVPIIPQSYARSTPNANTADSTVKRIDRKTVSYYYDENTEIEYSLTYTGFKEDIVVNEYTGQTEYEFILYTDGNSLVCEDGSYYVVDEDGAVKATVGDIIIITADNKNNTMGSIRSEVIEENEVYALTVVVDEDYLKDEKTTYPIRIDPTVEITYANNGAGAILDMTINSLDTSNGYSTAIHVGKRGIYGVSRILMKFPGLDLDDVLSSVNITEATVSIRDIMCQSEELTVECHAFTGNVWDEDTVSWTAANGSSCDVNVLDEVNVSYSNGKTQTSQHRYVFDITTAVKGWKSGLFNQDKGIVFKAPDSVENGSTNLYKSFGSYNRESYQPMLSLTYSDSDTGGKPDGTYYLNNLFFGKYLRYVSGTTDTVEGKSGLLSNLQDTVKWEIRKTETGYLICSTSDTTKYLAVPSGSSSQVIVNTHVDGLLHTSNYWDITTSSLGGMILKNKYNGRYLYLSGQTVSTVESYGAISSETHASCTWRFASDSYLGYNGSATHCELPNGFTIDDIIVGVNESVTPKVKEYPSNAVWVSAKDFVYSYVSGTNNSVAFDAITAIATGNKIGIASYTATHKVTERTYTFTVYVDRYTYELVNLFEFDTNVSLLIRDLYNRIDDEYSSESEKHKAWVAARVLSEFAYSNPIWNGVAGSVNSNSERQGYFTNILKYSVTEYNYISDAISSNHIQTEISDFAHMQYSIAIRLAYSLREDGISPIAGVFCVDEDVSYMGGWLGDATLIENGNTHMANDDYCADLDAENIFRLIDCGLTSVNAINSYYNSLKNSQTRASVFLEYIPYEVVKSKVFDILVDTELRYWLGEAVETGNFVLVEYYSDLLNDEQYHFDTIQERHPDTYNFLKSLEDELANIQEY